MDVNRAYRPPRVYQVEGNSGKITGTFTDAAGDGVVPATLTLLLYDKATSEVINERNRQDVLNTNGVTVASGGVFTWEIDPDDNEIIGDVPVDAHEQHVALFEWTFGSDGYGRGEIDIRVFNLGLVPEAS